MSRQPIFTGVATALITPMTPAGVDYESLGRLIDWQIEQGIDGIVVCGTTGESATLTDQEHRDVISFAVERAAGRIPIIAGTGSNETSYAVGLTRFASEAGAAAALVVTPYYNKTTQRGLIRHYTEIADASTIPVILYNVPSRTGINIEPATYEALAKHPRIAAIKEASGNIAKAVDTMSRVSGQLDLYSGNDGETVPLMSLGALGCISVMSNIMPAQTREIAARYLAGDITGAAELQFKYRPMVDALFSEVNPIPVKAAMAAMGFCDPYIRGPLTEMDEEKFAHLISLMRAEGLNV